MSFSDQEVVKGVDIELKAGEVHAIVGENGAGKSTVAKIFAGVHRPTAGSVLLNGQEIQLQNPRQALAQGIALIHQEPLTFPDLDVAENIFVGHQPLRNQLWGVDWQAMHRNAAVILESIGVKLQANARVGALSVADQQLVELAAALSHRAQVLLMDETTASLTPKEVAELFTVIRQLRQEGRAIAFVSHHLEEIFEIADRISVMRDGEKVAELLPSETSIDELVRLMVGRSVHSAAVRTRSSLGLPNLLKVTNLSVKGRFHAVSFDVHQGEIVGLGGLVGSGRTDVCETLFGIHKPTDGQIELDGRAVTVRNPRSAMRMGMALVPEDRQREGLHAELPISVNTTMTILKSISRFGWLNRIREAALTSEFASRLKTVMRSIHQPVRELSGGNQQKIVLAKGLATKPKLLILDEPTRGVDIGAKEAVHTLIRELADQGLGILLVSSDLPELLALSDRIFVMHEGRITGNLVAEQASPEGIMRLAAGLGGA